MVLMSNFLNLFTITEEILRISKSKFTDQELKYFNFFISHGVPPEERNNFIAAYASNIYPFSSGGEGVSPSALITIPVTDVTVSIRTCTPVIEDKQYPTPAEYTKYAESAYISVFKIYCAIEDARRNGNLKCVLTSPPTAQAVEEQGGLAGWDITVTVEV